MVSCGRKADLQKDICGFKNIRIRVDGALIIGHRDPQLPNIMVDDVIRTSGEIRMKTF